MIDITSCNCVACLWLPIAKTEWVAQRQEFHIVCKGSPAAGIIVCAVSRVRLNLSCLEDDCRVWECDALCLLLASKGVVHAEGVVQRQQFDADGAAARRADVAPAARVVLHRAAVADQVALAVSQLHCHIRRLEGNQLIDSNVLGLLLAGIGVSHAEWVTQRQ